MVDEKEQRPANWRPTQTEAVSAWLDAQLDNPARFVPLVLGADHELTVCARGREWRIFEPNFDFLAAHDSLPVRSLVALSVGLHPFFGDEAWVYQDALPYFQGRRDPDTDLAFDEDDQNECARAVTQLSTFIQRVSVALSALRAGTLPNTHNGVGGPETTATEFWAFARAKGWDVPDALAREPSAPVVSSSPVASKPLSRFASQDAVILAAIQGLGHDAKKLPKNKPGKSGVKAEVRDIVNRERRDLFPDPGSGVFDRAWERLRAAKQISDVT